MDDPGLATNGVRVDASRRWDAVGPTNGVRVGASYGSDAGDEGFQGQTRLAGGTRSDGDFQGSTRKKRTNRKPEPSLGPTNGVRVGASYGSDAGDEGFQGQTRSKQKGPIESQSRRSARPMAFETARLPCWTRPTKIGDR